MIHYTLRGPVNKLEIYAEKLLITPTFWPKDLTPKPFIKAYSIDELEHFQFNATQSLFWNTLDWRLKDGTIGSVLVSTDPELVLKISAYLQKRIEKNLGRPVKKTSRPRPAFPVESAA